MQRHTENFFRALEHKNWRRVGEFIGNDYRDQWEHDRARVIERARAVLSYMNEVHIKHSDASVRLGERQARWIARITIEAAPGEIAVLVKERVNSITTPFELEWRRVSAKPWDWKLVRVSNSGLEIPEGVY